MSVSAAWELLDRAQSDNEFQNRLLALPSATERTAFVHECGYDVAPEDFEALKEAAGLSELSEADLERIAAGGSTTLEIAAGVGGGLGLAAGASAAAAAV